MKNNRPLIYLASPYTHAEPIVMELRAQQAAECTAALKRNGWHIISPIAHGHAVAKYGTPMHSSWWRDYNFNVLARCDGMIVLALEGWPDSVGVSDEIAFCDKIGLRHEFMNMKTIIKYTPTPEQYNHLWERVKA